MNRKVVITIARQYGSGGVKCWQMIWASTIMTKS